MPHFVHFTCRIIENDLFKQDWRSRTRAEIVQYVVLKWTLALLIGLGTGLVAFFNNIGVENIAGFKLLLTNNLMLTQKYDFSYQSYICIYSYILCCFYAFVIMSCAYPPPPPSLSLSSLLFFQV